MYMQVQADEGPIYTLQIPIRRRTYHDVQKVTRIRAQAPFKTKWLVVAYQCLSCCSL